MLLGRDNDIYYGLCITHILRPPYIPQVMIYNPSLTEFFTLQLTILLDVAYLGRCPPVRSSHLATHWQADLSWIKDKGLQGHW